MMDKGIVSKITKVKIENFQSHENTELNFYDGLNVIVGPSDQGKSAVIRAIKWVLYNEPRGTDFIRQGAAFARVTLEMSTGYKIIRERSKSKNRYSVIDVEGTESVFEGFGNDIPKEIINAHGIPKVILDANISSNLNLGEQLEGPFLLSETGATRAKAIGRLTGTHIIDSATRDSMTELRRENQTYERLENERNGIELRLKEYKELDTLKERLEASATIITKLELKLSILQNYKKLEESLEFIKNEGLKSEEILEKFNQLDKCEEIAKKCIDYIKVLQVASKLNMDFKELSEHFDRLNIVLERTRNTQECEIISKKAGKLKERLHKLNNIRSNMKNVNEEMRQFERVTEGTNRIEELFENIKIAEDSFKKLSILVSTRKKYVVICNHIMEGIKYNDENKLQIKRLVEKYTEILKEAGKCPTCGSEISGLQIDEILKHYGEASL